MRRNRTEGRPVVYLDETWANAHDGKVKAWVEKDTTTGGTIGGVQGFVVFLYLFLINIILTVNHPEKENVLLYCTPVEKMDGFLVSK